MGQKRKHSQIVTDRMPYNRPSRSSLPEASALLEVGEDQHSEFASAQPRIDPNCGQRGAFPGLDDGPDELFYGPANDGLDYLRMVRSEAKGVPNLLVAPKQDGAEEDQAIYDSGVGDTRGYYQSGAYIAAPTLGPVYSADTSSIEEDKDPQFAYYEALAVRFESFRANLRRAPPTGAIAALDEKHPISLPWGSAEATAQWRRLLHSTNPLPAQLVAMDQQTVLSLIKLIVNGMKRGRSIEKRTSQWIWALLGKLNDAGCLGSEEVGVVRDLGKRAVWLLMGIRQKKKASDTGDANVEEELQDEDDLAMYADTAEDEHREPLGLEMKPVDQDKLLYADLATKTTLQTSSDAKQEKFDRDKAVEIRGTEEFEEGEINEEDQLAALKERMMARVASTSVEVGNSIGLGSGPPVHVENTVVTIDMILTIVGELYGQRDLLEYRDLWDEEQ
ncbi:MAG: hypothetical protein M1835_007727 [Candelina submexicana]|nr:MAG: hypothetical protein M1835_007727 [Candelina submexicana]